MGCGQAVEQPHEGLLAGVDCRRQSLLLAVLLGLDEPSQAAGQVGQRAAHLCALALQRGEVLPQEGDPGQREVGREIAIQHGIHGCVESFDEFGVKQQTVEGVEGASSVGTLDQINSGEDLVEHLPALSFVVDDLLP